MMSSDKNLKENEESKGPTTTKKKAKGGKPGKARVKENSLFITSNFSFLNCGKMCT